MWMSCKQKKNLILKKRNGCTIKSVEDAKVTTDAKRWRSLAIRNEVFQVDCFRIYGEDGYPGIADDSSYWIYIVRA